MAKGNGSAGGKGKARTRCEGTVLESWAEVDEHLEQLAHVQRQVREFEGQVNEQIDALRGQLAEYTTPLLETEKRLGLEVEQFLVAHQGEFEKVRTRELAHGKVGFRRSEVIDFKPKLRAENVIGLCKEHGHAECVKVKETVDKEALAKLTTDDLSKVGCRRVPKDTPWFEVAEVRAATGAVEI
ncbi:MAG: hypothetical protein A2Y38_07725 [Spirochaetes bacterium GWB1_59_5]|nr:MAG: hypothetical protein A2Y38_07725 [Spirochaetes bacterium GWB1_59_5]